MELPACFTEKPAYLIVVKVSVSGTEERAALPLLNLTVWAVPKFCGDLERLLSDDHKGYGTEGERSAILAIREANGFENEVVTVTPGSYWVSCVNIGAQQRPVWQNDRWEVYVPGI